MRTRNLAVMFTDIVGFTAKTSRQTREENALMMRRHDALLLPVVRGFGGRPVKTIGDALLVVFDSPTNSVLCGMAVQDRLWDYGRRVPEADRIEVRIAVNLGEVRVVRGLAGTDVYGEPVNIAARVESEAGPGEVWFTESVYLAMNKAEVPAEEMGYRELKGIPEPVRLYRAARGSYALEAAPGAQGPVPQPPYGSVGLARVKGLAPPDPETLARAAAGSGLGEIAGRLGRLGDAAGRLGGFPGPLSPRARRIGAAAAAAAILAAAAWQLGRSPALRAIEAGRFAEARAAVDRLAREKGAADAEVLYLRGRLEQERIRRDEGGSQREMFDLYGRAAAAGSSAALSELEHLARSKECSLRRGAARALGETRSRDALPALRRLSEEEPEGPSDPLESVKRLIGGGGARCGAGDVAREGVRRIEETP